MLNTMPGAKDFPYCIPGQMIGKEWALDDTAVIYSAAEWAKFKWSFIDVTKELIEGKANQVRDLIDGIGFQSEEELLASFPFLFSFQHIASHLEDTLGKLTEGKSWLIRVRNAYWDIDLTYNRRLSKVLYTIAAQTRIEEALISSQSFIRRNGIMYGCSEVDFMEVCGTAFTVMLTALTTPGAVKSEWKFALADLCSESSEAGEDEMAFLVAVEVLVMSSKMIITSD